mgnify:CR=1 FL=1
MSNTKGLISYGHISWKEYQELNLQTRAKVRRVEKTQREIINPLWWELNKAEEQARIEAYQNGVSAEIEALNAQYAPIITDLEATITRLQNKLHDLRNELHNRTSEINSKAWNASYTVKPELREAINLLWKRQEAELRKVAGLAPKAEQVSA